MSLEDDRILTEALVQWAGDPRDCTPRQEHAYELAEAIAAEHNATPEELLTVLN